MYINRQTLLVSPERRRAIAIMGAEARQKQRAERRAALALQRRAGPPTEPMSAGTAEMHCSGMLEVYVPDFETDDPPRPMPMQEVIVDDELNAEPSAWKRAEAENDAWHAGLEYEADEPTE